VVSERVLDELPDEQLAVYVVWMPVLASDDRDAALESRSLVSDPRARHFWDLDQSLGRALGRSLDLPRGGNLAWDMYLVFEPEATWGDAPPEPTFWNHQLGFDDRSLGDGSALREALEDTGR